MKKTKVIGVIVVMLAFAIMSIGSGSSTPSSTQSVKVADNSLTDDEVVNASQKEEAVASSDEISYEITDTNFEYYTNSIGSVEYYGYVEITNTGNNKLYLNKAVFDLEDNDGHLLQSDDFISSTPSVIEPGEKGYFYNGLGSNLIDEGVSADNGINLVPQITVKQATGEAIRYEVTDTDLREDGYGSLKVTGRVVNDTDKDVNYLYINVIFYDDNGRVLGITGTSITGLASGNKASFECSTMFTNDKLNINNVAEYKVIAEDMYIQF